MATVQCIECGEYFGMGWIDEDKPYTIKRYDNKCMTLQYWVDAGVWHQHNKGE